MLKVLTVTNDPEATMPLINSLEKHGWQWDAVVTDWHGFGTKLIATYNYLKANPEITSFIFCDAFDVLALGNEAEFKEKIKGFGDNIVTSSERGLWPQSLEPYRHAYADFEHGFNFINSGLYYAPSKLYIELFENNHPEYSTDDQEWFNMNYLTNKDAKIVLDNNQVVFNSHSFIRDEGEYGYLNGRLQILGNEPLWAHFNGRSPREKVDNLTKNG